MPTEAHMHEALARYTKCFSAGDADGVAALYAPDATIEDPIGAPLLHGHDEIRAFYKGAAEVSATIALDGAVRARADQCAAPLLAQIPSESGVTEMEIVDVMTFNGDGLIQSMRAFWGEANVRAVAPDRPGADRS